MKLLRLPIVIVVTYAFALTGCGQKGPLYLPEKQTAPLITTEPTRTNVTNSQATSETEATTQDQASPEYTNEAAQ
ncbi:lipoprotein [Entomomonas asaccharolytica]|uniref:Lipoprotein n=1 Tax=Entomomonas asaccharolytica TaxID=2785331 RepID=A0A974NG92_9GAMM|nr:lipoprotein [Entomomonas asaccharolytica]